METAISKNRFGDMLRSVKPIEAGFDRCERLRRRMQHSDAVRIVRDEVRQTCIGHSAPVPWSTRGSPAFNYHSNYLCVVPNNDDYVRKWFG